MKSSSLQRIIKSGVVNFFRNGLVSIATVFIISLSLFLLTSVLLGSVFLHSFINELQNKVDVSVYFKRSVAEADVVQLIEAARRRFDQRLPLPAARCQPERVRPIRRVLAGGGKRVAGSGQRRPTHFSTAAWSASVGVRDMANRRRGTAT